MPRCLLPAAVLLPCLLSLPAAAAPALPFGLMPSGPALTAVSPAGTFKSGDEVTLISVPDMVVHCCARIGKAAAKPEGAESFEIEGNADLKTQALESPQADSGINADTAPALVIKGRVQAGAPGKRGLPIDIDGKKALLRACPSSEGIHVTLWENQAKGKRLWHGYVYLGADMESACSEGETR